ncbi:MAG TPA: lipocalin family protein [Chitinophagales bacterium]|nr:lipocalin family protein [Chitinophagales bacterium]
MATSFNILTAVSDLLTGVNIPEKAHAVKPFDQKRYLGKWYEIARLDYYFERNLDSVTATYSLRGDGKIKVDNKGFNFKENKWEESIGKAVPVDDPTEARLKVSFFGPFYAGYNVIAIDKDYKYALVAGKNLDYLWLLSRETTMPDDVKAEYLAKASAIGYDTGKLIWVDQSRNAA